jgi:hypothetical protein
MNAPSGNTSAIAAPRLRRTRIAFCFFAAMMLPGHGLVQGEEFGAAGLLHDGSGRPLDRAKSERAGECTNPARLGRHKTGPRYFAIGLMRGVPFTHEKPVGAKDDSTAFEPMLGIVDYSAVSPAACVVPSPAPARPRSASLPGRKAT